MQFSRATLLAVLAALVEAQSIGTLVGEIPSCAVSCLTTAIAASGCGLTDYVCQCTTGHNTILANSAGCVSQACSTSDVLTTTNVTNEICSIALASGTPSSSASSVASTAASTATSAVSSATSAASSISSTATTAISSGASTTSATVASSATPASTTASSAASVASTSAPATATSNAGSGFKVGAGMMGAAVIAAIAL